MRAAAVALCSSLLCAQRDPEVERALGLLRADPARTAAHLATLAARPEAAGRHLSEIVESAPRETTQELATLVAGLVELAPYEQPPSNLTADLTPLVAAALKRRNGPEQHLLITASRRWACAREVSANDPIEEIARHLHRNDVFAGGIAARVLLRRGEAAQKALPELLEAFDRFARLGPDKPLRVFVARSHNMPPGEAALTAVSIARSIVALAPTHVRALLPHAVVLLHGEREERLAAVHALARAGDAAREVIPQLTLALRTDDIAVAQEAATALGALGPAAREAIPELERLAAGPHRHAAARAHAALRAIRGE